MEWPSVIVETIRRTLQGQRRTEPIPYPGNQAGPTVQLDYALPGQAQTVLSYSTWDTATRGLTQELANDAGSRCSDVLPRPTPTEMSSKQFDGGGRALTILELGLSREPAISPPPPRMWRSGSPPGEQRLARVEPQAIEFRISTAHKFQFS